MPTAAPGTSSHLRCPMQCPPATGSLCPRQNPHSHCHFPIKHGLRSIGPLALHAAYKLMQSDTRGRSRGTHMACTGNRSEGPRGHPRPSLMLLTSFKTMPYGLKALQSDHTLPLSIDHSLPHGCFQADFRVGHSQRDLYTLEL